MQQLVLFQTGNIDFALDRNRIRRIRPLPENLSGAADRVPQKTIVVEGQDLLLIDLSADADNDAAAFYPPQAEMIIVKASPLALFADQVKSTIDVNGERMDELPAVFGGTARACFPKVLHLEDQVVLIIDPEALAEVESHAATLGAIPKTTCVDNDDYEKSPHTEKALSPIQLTSAPVVEDPLETVVGEKLRKIIGRRVEKVVAQTMARVLKQQLQL